MASSQKVTCDEKDQEETFVRAIATLYGCNVPSTCLLRPAAISAPLLTVSYEV